MGGGGLRGLGCLLVLLSLATVSKAAENSTPTVSIEEETAVVGIGGAYKVGKWTQFQVDVNAKQPIKAQFEIESLDPEGHPVHFDQKDVDLPAGRSRLAGRFQPGRLDAPLRVRLTSSDGSVLAEHRWTVKSDSGEGVASKTIHAPEKLAAIIVVVLGKPAGLTTPQGEPSSLTKPPISLFELKSVSDLPSDPAALDSVDVVLISGVQELDADRQAALHAWVVRGGHLIVSFGAEATKFAAGPWQEWVPIRVNGTTRLRDLSGIEGFGGKASRIPLTSTVPAARFARGDEEVLVTALDGPLVVRAPLGFGRVTLVGIDIDRPPLSKWAPLGDFLRKLVLGSETVARASHASMQGEQIAQQGLSDLATQLRSSKENVPDVTRTTSLAIMGLMVGYLLILGPLDYLLVHRVLKRPHLTWVTFPLCVAAATVGAVVAADRLNGGTLHINEVDVVDIDAASGALRGQSWFTVYSPQSSRYELVARPLTRKLGMDSADSTGRTPGFLSRLCWDGVPEEGFGGMYRAGGGGLNRPEYRVAVDQSTFENVPISIWSTKVVSYQWDEENRSLAASELQSPGVGQLTGSFTHSLPGPITDWVLAYGNRAYLPRALTGKSPPEIEPGVPFSPTRPDVYQRELNGYLTGAKARRIKNEKRPHEDQILIEQEPYDRLNRDPLDILRMATFHEKADGKQYTGLTNHGLRDLEFSNLLDTSRAVLFGRIDMQPAELAVRNDAGGKALPATINQAAFVRIVFPVRRTGLVPAELKDYSPSPFNPRERLLYLDRPAEAEIPPDAAPFTPNLSNPENRPNP